MQPKRHSLEFLRENAHLRVRTNTFAAVMRVRSALSFAVHSYFQQKVFSMLIRLLLRVQMPKEQEKCFR